MHQNELNKKENLSTFNMWSMFSSILGSNSTTVATMLLRPLFLEDFEHATNTESMSLLRDCGYVRDTLAEGGRISEYRP